MSTLLPRRDLRLWLMLPEERKTGVTPAAAARVKRREDGRVTEVKAKTIYGDERKVLELLGGSTSHVERTNLTSGT
ncbi:MAG: hypothetical protein AB1425_02275 [Actinomycetota bacterium]